YLYRWVNGAATTLGQTAVGQVNANTWYKLSMKVHANAIDIYKDDVLKFSVADAQFASGRVALYGEANTVAELNNVLVRQYAAVEPTVTVSSTPPPVPVSLSSLSVNPASLVGGSRSQGVVVLTGAAPAGGAVVSLSSNTG